MAAVVIVLVGQAMTNMDSSIMTVAAPSLQASLHASNAEVQLIVAMYTLTIGAVVVTGARLGDIIGLRRSFVLGLGAFTVSSLAAGLAPGPEFLIAARTLQGAAAGVMTPQVLSIIQTQFDDQRRARAVGAYSMVLALGVAAGQVLGGVVVSAHLSAAAWRPALLLNVPVGLALLASCPWALRTIAPSGGRQLDVGGVGLLTVCLLALIVPLSVGRDEGWPLWIWPSFASCMIAGWAFVARERVLKARGADPLFDLAVLALPGVATGVLAVILEMAAYSGFLLALTLFLQGSLGFSPLHAGLTFAIYATGFALASLTWARLAPGLRRRLPVLGPLLMGAGLLLLGALARDRSFPIGLAAPLLFSAGVGHASGFAPLTHRLTTLVATRQAPDLSGLVVTGDWIGVVLGVAGFTGIYLSFAPTGPGHALALTAGAIAATLLAAGAAARASVKTDGQQSSATARHDCPLVPRAR
jgi:MFS family permease